MKNSSETSVPLIPFLPREVAKRLTKETAAAIRQTDRELCPRASDLDTEHMAAALIYSLRTFLSPEERKPLGLPRPEINFREPTWLKAAQKASLELRTPEDKVPNEEQRAAALEVINLVAAELARFGYKKFSQELNKFTAENNGPARPVPILRAPTNDV